MRVKRRVNVNVMVIRNTLMNESKESELEGLLKAGVHFGHPSSRWNAKMAPYIYDTKNGVHTLDVVKTLQDVYTAQAPFQAAKNVLFVGTKPQIAPVIKEIAQRCNGHYVNTRWVGGLLTNWSTMASCIKNLNTLDDQVGGVTEIDALSAQGISKKEILRLKKNRARLGKFFEGVRGLKAVPDLVVIVGQPFEKNAVSECIKLGIPTITLLDSNCDPTLTTYGIVANDDSASSVKHVLELLITNTVK
jgi:small subunit ribosomal protein S2